MICSGLSSDSISCPFVWDIFLNTGKIKSRSCSSLSFKYHFVVQSFLVSFHCAVFAKSFDSIMIIGVENGSEKYQTKRVNAIQFESKLSGNISKMWLTYFYDVSVFSFTVSKIHLALLFDWLLRLFLSLKISKFKKLFTTFLFCKQSRQTALPDISAKASVSFILSCRFWSLATRCFGRSLFSWTKMTNFRFRQNYILTYILFEFKENSYSFWASDYT